MTNETDITTARELVADEDALSPSLRAALEQVGSAAGFVLSFALLFALLPRAGRALAALACPSRSGTCDEGHAAALEQHAPLDGSPPEAQLALDERAQDDSARGGHDLASPSEARHG